MDPVRKLQLTAEQCFLKVLGVYKLQPRPTTDPTLTALGQRYNIKFVTDDEIDCHDLSYERPAPVQLKLTAKALLEEMTLYPQLAMASSGIEQIILCKNLQLGRKSAAGTLMVGLHYVDTLFLDVSTFTFDELHARRTLHHELFHAIDFRDTLLGYIDPEWRRLQGEEYRYELDRAIDLHIVLGRDPQGLRPREFDDPYHRMSADESQSPGFVSKYATYSVPEDKAELFCHLMTSYDAVMARCNKDKVLSRKVERMKHLLFSFCEEFNEDFWHNRKRTGQAKTRK